MSVAATLGEVVGFSLKDLYEEDDENYILFVAEVIEGVVNARENINREIKRRSG